MRGLFMLILILRILRILAPWIIGFFASLVLVSLLPLPPLGVLLAVIIGTVAIAHELETNLLRDFERTNPRSYGSDIPKWSDRSSRSRRR